MIVIIADVPADGSSIGALFVPLAAFHNRPQFHFVPVSNYS